MRRQTRTLALLAVTAAVGMTAGCERMRNLLRRGGGKPVEVKPSGGEGGPPAVAAKPPPQQRVLDLGAGVRMKLTLIPAGTFMMGAPTMEAGRRDDEGPLHQVVVTRPFYIGVTEVTQAQWRAVVGTEPWQGKALVKEADDYAATWVSWRDAMSFCEQMSVKSRCKASLPTEAQWEYACRAGHQSRFGHGENELSLADYAWYSRNVDNTGKYHAQEVARKRPNDFGLHDMHGNVYEWCRDWYGAGHYARSPRADPPGPPAGQMRVTRGGAWSQGARDCRSAARSASRPDFRIGFLGFRVVVAADEPIGSPAGPYRPRARAE